MKKLLVRVNGKEYEVEVEVLEDDEDYAPQPQTSFPQTERSLESRRTSAAPPPKPRPEKKAPVSGDRKAITSPINGTVLDIHVSVGDEVKANDVLISLEAMKMKTNISSPFPGKIKSIKVKPGDNIETGREVLTFE